MSRPLFYIALVALALGSCTGVGTITKEDLSFLYDRNLSKMDLPARIYNVSEH